MADCVHEQLQGTPNAPIFIVGDFNHCDLNTALPDFEQYINCYTRKNRILDKCYGNLKLAYTATAKPPLSNSDHITVHLIPTYKTALKRFFFLNNLTKRQHINVKKSKVRSD